MDFYFKLKKKIIKAQTYKILSESSNPDYAIIPLPLWHVFAFPVLGLYVAIQRYVV